MSPKTDNKELTQTTFDINDRSGTTISEVSVNTTLC